MGAVDRYRSPTFFTPSLCPCTPLAFWEVPMVLDSTAHPSEVSSEDTPVLDSPDTASAMVLPHSATMVDSTVLDTHMVLVLEVLDWLKRPSSEEEASRFVGGYNLTKNPRLAGGQVGGPDSSTITKLQTL